MDSGTGRQDEPDQRILMPPLEPLPPGVAETLLAHSSDALVWYDRDGSVLWASPALERAFGWKSSDVIGTAFRLAPPADQERSRAEIVEAIARGDDGATVRTRAERADGSLGWADTAVGFVRDVEGAIIGLVASVRDVTAEVEAEQRYRLVAENMSDVVVHVRDGCVAWVSPSVGAVFGAPPLAWLGRPMVEFVHPDDFAIVLDDIASLVPGVNVMSRQRIRGADDTYHWVESNSRAYIDAAGAEDGFLTSLRVVDDLVASERELARRARIDDLTGLMNRAEVLQQLGHMVDKGRRRGDNVAVLFCDIDWFKDVNDKHGHAGGDEVLRVVAERIASTIRQDDVAARFGGDEILVVLAGVHDVEEAQRVAEKVRLACREEIDLSGAVVQVTVSIGVTLAPAGRPIDEVIAHADRAMYEAKQSGRDRVVSL